MKMEKRIELTEREMKLHQEACAYARQHRDSEHGLCRVLREVDESKLYLKFGYSRTFYYAVKELKLTESVASMTITVARKTALIPELRAAVDEERLSVSKASRIASNLTLENANDLIAFAQTHTSNEIDAEMARRNPEKPRRDTIRHIGNGKVEIRAQISIAVYEKYQRAQAILASKRKPTNFEGVMDENLELFLERHDPVRRAERAQVRDAKRTHSRVRKLARSQADKRAEHKSKRKTEQAQPNPTELARTQEALESNVETSATEIEFCLNRMPDSKARDSAMPRDNSSKPKSSERGHYSKPKTGEQNLISTHSAKQRKHIKAKTNHALMLHTRGQCCFVNEHGERCTEDRYLHRHHIIPLSKGGSDDLSNLTLLCPAHHELVHQLSFAIDGQLSWLRSPQVAYQARAGKPHGCIGSRDRSRISRQASWLRSPQVAYLA